MNSPDYADLQRRLDEYAHEQKRKNKAAKNAAKKPRKISFKKYVESERFGVIRPEDGAQ
jgi:hypothetical protein